MSEGCHNRLTMSRYTTEEYSRRDGADLAFAEGHACSAKRGFAVGKSRTGQPRSRGGFDIPQQMHENKATTRQSRQNNRCGRAFGQAVVSDLEGSITYARFVAVEVGEEVHHAGADVTPIDYGGQSPAMTSR